MTSNGREYLCFLKDEAVRFLRFPTNWFSGRIVDAHIGSKKDFLWILVEPRGGCYEQGFEGHIPKSAVGRYHQGSIHRLLVAGGMTSVKEAEKGKVESTTDMHSATGVASAEF